MSPKEFTIRFRPATAVLTLGLVLLCSGLAYHIKQVNQRLDQMERWAQSVTLFLQQH